MRAVVVGGLRGDGKIGRLAERRAGVVVAIILRERARRDLQADGVPLAEDV